MIGADGSSQEKNFHADSGCRLLASEPLLSFGASTPMFDKADWSYLWTWWLAGPLGFIGLFAFGAVAWVVYVRLRNSKRSNQVQTIVDSKEKNGLLNSSHALTGFKKKNFTMDISFHDMGLKLKTNGRVVLSKVNGTVRHGRMTAVMGPSGSGKTTFMTTLAGRAYYGRMLGHVLVNGKKDRITNYKNLTGFVPQEDVMLREMTVRENLQFSASTRLPSSMSSECKDQLVDDVLSLLDLSHLQYSQIGDENVRGISGGQRKRVNIGIELVADPTLLFLDEPTSGLDSSSTMSICGALRTISELGLTIVAVIHQPRFEVFRMFHDVLLLGNGGRAVYLGPTEQALPYFEELGYKCPEHCNPADFFLDIISGQVMKEDGTMIPSEELPRIWRQNSARFRSEPEPEDDENMTVWGELSNSTSIDSMNSTDSMDSIVEPQADEECGYTSYQSGAVMSVSELEDEEAMNHPARAPSESSFGSDEFFGSDGMGDGPIGLAELKEIALKFIPPAILKLFEKEAHKGYEELGDGDEEGTVMLDDCYAPEREEDLQQHHHEREVPEGSWITFWIWAVSVFLVFIVLPFATTWGKPSKLRQYGALLGFLVLWDLVFIGYVIEIFTQLDSGEFGSWIVPIFLYWFSPLCLCIYCTVSLSIDLKRRQLSNLRYVPQFMGGFFMSVFYVWYMWKRKHVTVAKRVAALAGNLAFGWGVLIVTGLALGMGSRTSVGTLAMWPETLGVGLPFILFTVVLLRRAHVLPGDPLMIAAEKAAKKAEEEAQKRAKQTKAAEEKQAKQAKVEEEKQRRMRLKKEENARMELSSKSDRQKVSVLRQIPLFMHRSLLQYTRHWMATIFDLLLVISAGLFAGIIYYHVYYIASPLADAEYLDDVCEGETSTACMMVTMPAQDPFPGQASITCLGLALAGVASSMRVFGDELVIFRRESEAGLSTEAYYIGKSLAHLPTEFLAPFLFTVFYYAIALPLAPFYQYFLVYYLIYATCAGLAFFVSLVTPQSLSQLAGVLTILSFMMFSGAAPTLTQLEQNLLFPYILYWCSYFSLFRWTQELYYIVAVKPYNPGPGGTLAYYGYEMSDEAMCWVFIIALLIVFRVLAYIALVIKEKRH